MTRTLTASKVCEGMVRDAYRQGFDDGRKAVDERLTWTYSGQCPKCGFVIEAELPALPSEKGPS